MSYQTLPLARCESVEIFATGQYRGKHYDLADLDEIARNFSELGPQGKALLRPPVVLGHEETQEFLEKTDLPAAAWPDKVWVERYTDKTTGKEEGILKANFAEVPPVIAKLINGRAYRKVSAEVYDDFTDDHGNSHGKALRRIALLGGEIPAVKRLRDIPLARFAERRKATHQLLALLGKRSSHPPVVLKMLAANHNAVRNSFICFAEVAPMDRATAIQQLLAVMPTLPQAVIDTMTDDQIKALVAAHAPATPPAEAPPMGMMADMPRETMIADLVAAGQDAAALEAMTDEELKAMYDSMMGGGPAQTMADPATMTREELIAALVAQGQDAAALESLTDDELRAMLGQTTAAPAEATLAEIGKPPIQTPVQPQIQPQPKPGAPMAANPAPAQPRLQPKSVTMKFAEQLEAEQKQALEETKKLRADVASERLKLAKAKREAKEESVELFCERLVEKGQIRPVDKPAYIAAMMAADEAKIVKFSDGGKTEDITAFEAKKRELLKLPVVIHFGEKIKGGGATDGTVELNKVRKFAESPGMAVALEARGRTPEEYVHTFSEAQKKKPKLTAAEFGVDPNYCS